MKDSKQETFTFTRMVVSFSVVVSVPAAPPAVREDINLWLKSNLCCNPASSSRRCVNVSPGKVCGFFQLHFVFGKKNAFSLFHHTRSGWRWRIFFFYFTKCENRWDWGHKVVFPFEAEGNLIQQISPTEIDRNDFHDFLFQYYVISPTRWHSG